MKAADIGKAQDILKAMAKLDEDEKALIIGIKSGGFRSNASSERWVELPPSLYPKITALMQEYINRHRAHLRREAAQIGLGL